MNNHKSHRVSPQPLHIVRESEGLHVTRAQGNIKSECDVYVQAPGACLRPSLTFSVMLSVVIITLEAGRDHVVTIPHWPGH